MNVYTFSACCLIALYLIIPAESATAKACCLAVTSMKLDPKRVKDYHIQEGSLCPIRAAVLLTVRDRRVCADPDSQWVIDAMTKVNKEKEAAKAGAISGPTTAAPSGGNKRPSGRRRGKGRGGRGGKGRGKGRRRAGRQQAQ